MPVPVSVTNSGPITFDGNDVYIETQVLRDWWEIKKDPTPSLEKDEIPPECSEKKTWHRRNVHFQEVVTKVYSADKKTNWGVYLGAAILLFAAGVLTGGGAIVIFVAAVESSAALGAVGGAFLIAGAGFANATAKVSSLPVDEYTQGGEISAGTPAIKEVESKPEPPEVDFRQWRCEAEAEAETGD